MFDQYSLIEQSLVLFVTAILESILNPGQSGFFKVDPATHMTWRKSDPFDPDMWIDPTRLQRWSGGLKCTETYGTLNFRHLGCLN